MVINIPPGLLVILTLLPAILLQYSVDAGGLALAVKARVLLAARVNVIKSPGKNFLELPFKVIVTELLISLIVVESVTFLNLKSAPVVAFMYRAGICII